MKRIRTDIKNEINHKIWDVLAYNLKLESCMRGELWMKIGNKLWKTIKMKVGIHISKVLN